MRREKEGTASTRNHEFAPRISSLDPGYPLSQHRTLSLSTSDLPLLSPASSSVHQSSPFLITIVVGSSLVASRLLLRSLDSLLPRIVRTAIPSPSPSPSSPVSVLSLPLIDLQTVHNPVEDLSHRFGGFPPTSDRQRLPLFSSPYGHLPAPSAFSFSSTVLLTFSSYILVPASSRFNDSPRPFFFVLSFLSLDSHPFFLSAATFLLFFSLPCLLVSSTYLVLPPPSSF